MPYSFGIGFWGANGHDGVWHLALANSLTKGSLQMPVFANVALQNYHIGFDLILALLTKTGISASVWYFQILPVIFSLLIGYLTYQFVFEWKKSTLAAYWSTFFVYFGGSFGWVITLLRGQGLGGESMFWSQQAVSTLINPPFALSLILILIGLRLLLRYSANHSLRLLVLGSIVFGLIIEIKAYAGILALGGLLVAGLYELVFKRKIHLIKLFVISLLVSAIVFLPLNGNASSLVVFQPGWFLETMLGISDRFYWPRAYEALMNWKSGNVFLKEIVGYSGAFVIFLLGNLGVRFMGVVSLLKFRNLKMVSNIDVVLVVMLLGGIIAPTLFLQNGTPWNTIQFFYYSLFVLSLYAGISTETLFGKLKPHKLIRSLTIGFIVILTVPTTISTLSQVYLPGRAPAKISHLENEALEFLADQPEGVVLTFPYDAIKAQEAVKNPPRPLYLYDSTSYVSAFSQKPTFLEDEVNLTIMGYDWKTRRSEIEQFYREPDQVKARAFLKNNNITYIYWLKGQRALLGETQLGIERLYENDEVDIYKVTN